MAEGGALLRRYTGHTVSRVRIPHSPPVKNRMALKRIIFVSRPYVVPIVRLLSRLLIVVASQRASGGGNRTRESNVFAIAKDIPSDV